MFGLLTKIFLPKPTILLSFSSRYGKTQFGRYTLDPFTPIVKDGKLYGLVMMQVEPWFL